MVVTMMLVSVRIFGFFLVMPLFAFRALPMRIRVVLSFVLAIGLMPLVRSNWPSETVLSAGYGFVALELAIGMTAGFFVRVGLGAIELLAEVLSVQSGLSFASSALRDPVLVSGLTGEFLGLLSLALAFIMNVHLLLLEILLTSFRVIPFGVWPSVWNPQVLIELMQASFLFGMVLSMPAIVVYMLFNMTQGMLARVSPQMNLFSIGFAIMVPVSFIVIAILLPSFPAILQRALEMPVELIRRGLNPS